MIVWLTQLGFTVAIPPVGFILLAVWLRDRWDWGGWVIWLGIALGLVCAIDGLRISLKTMRRMSEKREEKPTVSFNEHD